MDEKLMEIQRRWGIENQWERKKSYNLMSYIVIRLHFHKSDYSLIYDTKVYYVKRSILRSPPTIL